MLPNGKICVGNSVWLRHTIVWYYRAGMIRLLFNTTINFLLSYRFYSISDLPCNRRGRLRGFCEDFGAFVNNSGSKIRFAESGHLDFVDAQVVAGRVLGL